MNFTQNFLAPRALAYLNGMFIPSWDITVEQAAYNTTDTISVKTVCADAPVDFGALSQQQSNPLPLLIKIGAPSDPSSYTSTAFDQLIYGLLDEIETDYDDEDVIEFKGRGVLALLSDARTTQRVNQNVDVSVALKQLIEGVGLTASINGGQPAGVTAGRILQDDFVMMGRNIRILEYMQTLANGVGWVMRAQGTTIIVGPPPDRNKVPTITKDRNKQGSLKLNVRHSALHAHDIKVRVVSYIPKVKTRVTSGQTQPDTSQSGDLLNPGAGPTLQLPTPVSPSKSKSHTVTTGGKSSGTATGNFQFSRQEEYVFHIPGLTSQEADAQAALIQAEISRHEFVADLTFAPTANELRMLVQNSPEFLVKLEGCSQSSHNQLYHPRKVTWTYTLEDGLKVQLLMVNHDIPTNTGGE